MDETKNPENTESLSDPENAKSIADLVSTIGKGVPDSEWARLPTDLSKNVDHYLYGTKKFAE